MSLLLLLALSAATFPEGETEPEPPESKSFDVDFGFDDEETEEPPLPEGDAPAEVDVAPEPPPPAPPPLAPPPPPPAGPGVIAVFVPTDTVRIERGAHIARRLTEVLAERQQLRAIDLRRQIDPGADTVAAQEIEAGKQAVIDGVRAFEELDLETAGAQLDVGVNTLLAYERALTDEDRQALSSAIFAYGTTVLFEGRSDLADAIFVALAVTAPDFSPAAERYPSNVVDRFDSVRSSVSSRPTGTLHVDSDPAGAAVYIDGTFRGFAPLDVGGLADGWHLVTVERLGYRPFGTLAPVPSERRSTVTLELEPSDAFDTVNGWLPMLTDDDDGVRALGQELGAASIAVLRYMTPLSGDRVEGLLIPASGPVVRIGPTPIASDPDLAARTIADAFEAKRPVAVVMVPTVEEAPVTGEWWFWAAVGGAVLVAAAGTAAVVSASGDGGPPSNSGVVLGF